MRNRQLIILAFFLPFLSIGQSPSDSLIGSFYNKTLALYFSDSTIHKDQVKFGCILVQTDFNTGKLINESGDNKFKFYCSSEPAQSVLDKPLQKNAERNIYRIYHRMLGHDTIDINIDVSTIEFVDNGNLSLAASCGGTMGYIPSARFVYNKTLKFWTYISRYELMDEKALKEKNN